MNRSLKDLEDKGVVIRTILATSPPSAEYSLSDLGEQLLPAINEIARIGHNLKLQLGAVSKSKASRAEDSETSLVA